MRRAANHRGYTEELTFVYPIVFHSSPREAEQLCASLPALR